MKQLYQTLDCDYNHGHSHNSQNQMHDSHSKVKKCSIHELTHHEMISDKEKFSFSAVLTDALGLNDLFVHHEIIPPGRRSSSPHRHTHIEEMLFVLQGNPSVQVGNEKLELKAGDCVAFKPSETALHVIENLTTSDVKMLIICSISDKDITLY